MDTGETPQGWLTVEEVAGLKQVDVSVVREAVRRRALDAVTTHPAQPWRWMIRGRDAQAWTPVIELPAQPVVATADVSQV